MGLKIVFGPSVTQKEPKSIYFNLIYKKKII